MFYIPSARIVKDFIYFFKTSLTFRKKNYGRRCKYMSDTGLQVVIIISTASPKCLHYYLNDKTSSFIYFYWKRLVIITCPIVLLSGNEKKILWSFTTFRGTRLFFFLVKTFTRTS